MATSKFNRTSITQAVAPKAARTKAKVDNRTAAEDTKFTEVPEIEQPRSEPFYQEAFTNYLHAQDALLKSLGAMSTTRFILSVVASTLIGIAGPMLLGPVTQLLAVAVLAASGSAMLGFLALAIGTVLTWVAAYFAAKAAFKYVAHGTVDQHCADVKAKVTGWASSAKSLFSRKAVPTLA